MRSPRELEHVVIGPDVLVQTMSVPREYGKNGAGLWQYHSRSDFHSVVAAIGTTFDVLAESSLVRKPRQPEQSGSESTRRWSRSAPTVRRHSTS